MIKNKKVLLKVIVVALIISVYSTTIAGATSLPYNFYETKTNERLASGIVHENIRRFTSQGWLNINVLRIDIKNEHTELKGLFNKDGIPQRDTVSNMVTKHNAVAGVNGDYFNYSPMPSAMGTLINDGEVISSPIELTYALPSFYLNNENDAKIEYLNRSIVLKNITKDKTFHVNTLNKVTPKFDTPTLLDPNWGSKSVGNRFHKDLLELVVSNGKVVEIRENQPATDIPKDGYVIAGRLDRIQPLKEYEVGDEVELTVNTTPDVENIKFAIGGGSIILKNGEVTLTNINSSGSHPRTGIGVNKDNTEIVLVTVDGRTGKYRGLEQKQFGLLLKELGAYNGMNLDGGGSTTMAVKPNGADKAKVVNNPSGGSQRKVVNSVGVFSNAPKGVLDHIEVNLSEPVMFKNSTRSFSIKAYDGHRNPVEFNRDNVKVEVEGIEANLVGNSIIPTTEGNGKINIEYEGLKDSFDIKVLGEIKNIYSNEKRIEINKNGKYKIPSIYGQDQNGSKTRIYLNDLTIEVPEDIGRIEDGHIITNDSPNSGYLTIKYGDIVENIRLKSLHEGALESQVNVPESTKFIDTLNDSSLKEVPETKVIKVFSNTLTLSDEGMQKLKNNINESNTAISLNGFYNRLASGIDVNNKIDAGGGYKATKDGDVLIVNFDSRKGTLRLSNSYQYTHIKDSIMNTDKSNVIITTQKPLWGDWSFTDQEEADVLHKLLVDLKDKGKNVFVVHGGYYNTNELIDGVRYIGLDIRAEKNQEALNNISVINFFVNGSNVSYSREYILK